MDVMRRVLGRTLICVVISTGLALAPAVPSWATAPKISSFVPTSGTVGTKVTVSGSNLTGARSVKFNGLSSSFTVNSPTQITATVPASATTGTIAVTTPAGTTTSGSAYTVLPHISSFSPTSGAIGSSVTINGSGFDSVTGVTFN